MIAVESVSHHLAMAVRLIDHFSGAPWPDLLHVTLDTGESAVRAQGGSGIRHADGTYRFADLPTGPRVLTVASPDGTAFTWTATTPIGLPLLDPRDPIVVELWPSPKARIAAGSTVIRGRLVTAAAGQEVTMEVVGVAPRNRRTRCDATGEFVFVVVGPMELTTTHEVELAVTVPSRVLTSIQIIDGETDPVVAGTHCSVVPGRETRARFNLT